MSIPKAICVLALLVQLQVQKTSGTDSSPLLGTATSEELNSLFGNNFQSELQSQSLAYTHGNNHQRFANDRGVTDSDENDEEQVRNPKLDLLETDKNSQLEGEDESFYTRSSQRRNKHDVADSSSQESDSSSAATISKNDVHAQHKKVQTGLQNSPGVRRIMLLKPRVMAKENMANQDENEDDHESQDTITKITLHNKLSQTEESDKTHGDTKIQKRANVEDAKNTNTAETSGSAESPDTDAQASGKLEDQSKESFASLKGFEREQESETKGEPEFFGKTTSRALNGQGSGDFQHSGSGDKLLDKFLDKVTIVNGDSTKVVPGRRDPKRGSPLTKNVRSGAHFNPTRGIVKGEGSGESVSGKMSFDPVLFLQLRNIRTNVLNAEKQATKELNDVRQEFRAKMEDLEEDLRMVRKLTSNVHNKVGITVTQALKMARQAKTNATNRLHMARRAATALNNIEKTLGVIHTINASKILRSRIPQFPKLNDVALYKQVLATNAILTKLDGAKALAVYRAEKRFHNEEEMGSSIEEEVNSLRVELASAEEDLSEETDKEFEDEREAQEKIQEAMERNKRVAKKTAFALTAIENYLEKLQSDESKLKRWRF